MFTIYGLYEAGKPDEIQYVGCTGQPLKTRLARHQWEAAHNPKVPVHRWLLESAANGLAVEGRILQQSEHKPAALEMEWEWIIRFTRQGKHLLNLTRNPRTSQIRGKYCGDGAFVRATAASIARASFGNESVKNFLSYLRNLPM